MTGMGRISAEGELFSERRIYGMSTRLNGLSLFSGIGGIDLAFTWAGGHILAFCEIDNYCQQVLRKQWPDVPIFSDVHALNKEAMQNAEISTSVDVIYGGFPCQPFSLAGNKKGKDDTRYLWPEFSRLVGEIKPRWIVAENVLGILHIAADDVCADLERQGYSVGIWDFEAAAVGAKHRRERIFFVAHTDSPRLSGCKQQGELRAQAEGRITPEPERSSSALLAYSGSTRYERVQSCRLSETYTAAELCGGRELKPGMDRVAHGLPEGLDKSKLTFWDTVPEPADRTARGIPDRASRLKALGNAVVPQQVYPIFRAIAEADRE